jgi:c-di-GMP-binding flagellar brake protein YcgR
MDLDKRASIRQSINTRVQISHPSFGEVTVRSKDISDGGLSVYLGEGGFPPEGTKVDVLIRSLNGPLNTQSVKMEVKYIQSGVAGLKFL